MVLTAAQTTAFFEDNDQMGIPHATVVQLQQEGITAVSDLADFDQSSLQQLADNLRCPGGRVPNPDPGAAAGATIPTPPFVFGAKSQKRLLVACDLVRYYDTVGRDLTSNNIQWLDTVKNFEIQWKALKARKDEDEPDVPKISKTLPVIKWTESFQDFLNRVIGVRMIPLFYVVRPEVIVPAAAPALAHNQPHSTEHGSVEAELIARASHTHALYRDDNSSVYHFLEEATRATPYAASIKPFQRGKDGRGAWMALTSQYAGNDKWEAEIKKQEQLLHTRVWKGQSNFSLEQFISQHRNAYVSMQACAEHVQYQLPNEHSRVGFLLEAIQCSDAGLQAAMASVKTDSGPDGMRNNFEDAVAHLLPYDPVAKKRAAGTKRGNAYISTVDGDEVDMSSKRTPKTKAKASIGKTGVHLRYHSNAEYAALSHEQREELGEWRRNSKKEAAAKKQHAKKASFGISKKEVASMVAKALEEQLKKAADESTKDEQQEEYLMALVDAAVNKKLKPSTAASTTMTPTKVTLKSILKNAKNNASS